MLTFAKYFEKWPKQSTAQRFTKPSVKVLVTPLVRQYGQVNVLPARDKPAPLPPPPDNMVKDEPDNPE